MPTFYGYTQGGVVYSFDDVFVPADAFRQGNLWTWGRNNNGQIGDNTFTNRLTPVTTFLGGTNWKQASSGYNYNTIIRTDGTLWTWGLNGSGQLGTNNATQMPTPVTTFAGGTNWKQVACGEEHASAIKTDGTLWVWGRGDYGQMGNNLGGNTTFNRSTPVTTFAGGTNWKQVACGQRFVVAIKTDGTLWGWGDNFSGQIGNNTSGNDRRTPVTTFAGGTNWKQVACGDSSTLAIKTDGTLWVWGAGNWGQLGVNDSNQRPTPVTTFAGGTNWKQVSSGLTSAAAIKTDGTLWTWGYNYFGALGINNNSNSVTPVTTFTGGNNWKQVACANDSMAAIKTDGTLWTWGFNSYGRLGNNTTSNRSTPITTFSGGTNWKQVACGKRQSIATTYIDDYV